MFTGIIEEIGIVRSILKSPARSLIGISCSTVTREAAVGDSIAVNGVCLTAVMIRGDGFEADVSEETWARSNLSRLTTGSPVNLESSLRVGGKLGGHFVQGHVDGTGSFLSAIRRENSYETLFSATPAIIQFLVDKGSVAVNGISLTIAGLDEKEFSCAIVPHTWMMTNLKSLKKGDPVNLEIDILAKYVARLLHNSGFGGESIDSSKSSKIDLDFLADHGFL
jgi:riboflavin synthase